MQLKPEPRPTVPRGLWIALYGPDGAGKSAVAARVAAELAPHSSAVSSFTTCAFRCGEVHDRLLSSPSPHARQPRGIFLSCLKLFYMFLQSWMAHLLRTLLLARVRPTGHPRPLLPRLRDRSEALSPCRRERQVSVVAGNACPTTRPAVRARCARRGIAAAQSEVSLAESQAPEAGIRRTHRSSAECHPGEC